MLYHPNAGYSPPAGPHAALVAYVRNGVSMLRVNTRPIDPQTALSVLSRWAITPLSMIWEELTDAQRIAWQTYASATPIHAKHNKVRTIVGYAMFLRNNRYNVLYGYPIELDAPTSPGTPALPTPSVFWLPDENQVLVAFTLPIVLPNPSKAKLITHVSHRRSLRRNRPPERWAPAPVIMPLPAKGPPPPFKLGGPWIGIAPAAPPWIRIALGDGQGGLSDNPEGSTVPKVPSVVADGSPLYSTPWTIVAIWPIYYDVEENGITVFYGNTANPEISLTTHEDYIVNYRQHVVLRQGTTIISDLTADGYDFGPQTFRLRWTGTQLIADGLGTEFVGGDLAPNPGGNVGPWSGGHNPVTILVTNP